jgi:hypothetical protein
MTNRERLVRSQSIMRRQEYGLLSKWEAAAEFDRLLDESSGDLHFYSDTTTLRDVWNGVEVMVFPHKDTIPMDPKNPDPAWRPLPSNTGIICQGPNRGLVVGKPGQEESDAHPECLKEWGKIGEQKFHP